MEKDWVEIYSTTHEYKASMAKDLLENEGIKAVILNQHDSAYQAFGEFCVHVAKTDETKAVVLLKNLKL
jgi:predicted Fe-Mo cluster-binding NifX family protein